MTNPLLCAWQTPHQLPPFDLIKSEHYLPAFNAAFKAQNDEIDAIANNKEAPTFENTVEAIEASGRLLKRIAPVFYILNAAHTNDDLNILQTQIVPMHTTHLSAINTNELLFKRVAAVFNASAAQTKPHSVEAQSLLDKIYSQMQRSGAGLNIAEATNITKIDKLLAELQTQYGQNVLKDTNEFILQLSEIDELAGLPESVIEVAKNEAERRGLTGTYVFTLSRSSVTPFLQYAKSRSLREKMWRAYTQCAANKNEFNNTKVAEKIALLRAERAMVLGFASHADFMLDDRMAKTPGNVKSLLDKVWTPASAKVKQELKDLQACAQASGDNHKIEAWDWWYYTEKIRQKKFNFDSEQVKPYFELNRVRQGVFNVANKLFGIQFKEMPIAPAMYYDDVDVFEVFEANDKLIGIFICDYFSRPSKKSGAWMNALRYQQQYRGVEYPIILNTCNFPKGNPTLLSIEEVTTLFHEFGHALHGLLSQVKYASLSGTSVKRDFVELPSQIMEHWALEPEVLKLYAKHYETNVSISDEFIEKIKETQTFNQGFKTSEYLAASYLDLSWHAISHDNLPSMPMNIESNSMANIDLIKEIVPRYKSTYFQHIFSGGYSAGYYSYIWAEVLDADAYEEFKEKGIFDAKTAASFRANILAKGGTEDPMSLYRQFKGAEPQIEPLMTTRGLT